RPSRRTETSVLDRLRLNRRMVERAASALEERSDVVGQPEGREDRAHRTRQPPGNVTLGHHDGNLFGNTGLSQCLQNMFHHLWFPVERLPGNPAGFEWIVLHGEEGQIAQMTVGLQ